MDALSAVRMVSWLMGSGMAAKTQGDTMERTLSPARKPQPGSRLMTRVAAGPKPPPGKSGMIRWIDPGIEDVVTGRSVPGAYRLPAGLPEGAQLRLVRFQDSTPESWHGMTWNGGLTV